MTACTFSITPCKSHIRTGLGWWSHVILEIKKIKELKIGIGIEKAMKQG